MLKLTVAVLAVVLAGTASGAEWRSLRIDASSEASFQESIAAFQAKLTPSRRIAFTRSLQDIWLHGEQAAEAQEREYTDADYLRQIHGLGYEEVVTLTDPTGKKERRYRAEYRGGGGAGTGGTGWPSSHGPPPVDGGAYRGASRSIDRQTH